MAWIFDDPRTDKLKDPDNIIRLRSDTHSVFDAKRFTIVPIQERLVVYCLNAGLGSQVERLYHGVEVHRIPDSGLLNHFLFSRFAYTVFERLRVFLEAGISRKLRLLLNDKMTVEICNPERCWRFAMDTARQGKSGSVSPKKRPRSEVESAVESDDNWMEEEFRGRKRHRNCSEHSSTVDYSADMSEPSALPMHLRSGAPRMST